MKPKAAEALEASISKWRRNAKAKAPDDFLTKADDCHLCDLYWHKTCHGCPVSAKTDEPYCRGTPYIAAYRAGEAWHLDDTPDRRKRARATARKEVAFLESLRE